MGNLIQVIEPNPAGGADLTTNYAYNVMSQLTQSTLTRDGVTQTRTFVWGGTNMVSTTNPENGTVTYTYDGDNHVTQKTDAIGQQTQYSYDVYHRLTEVRHYAWANVSGTLVLQEQPLQRVDYYYDTNQCGDSFSQNPMGRLTAVGFRMDTNLAQPGCRYQYSYNTAGRVVSQKMSWIMDNSGVDQTFGMTATYAWDTEGRMTSQQYPSLGSQQEALYQYQFDANGRLSGMTGDTSAVSATFGVAGELQTLTAGLRTDTRTYNSMFQLTHITSTVGMDVLYTYDTTGHNNGRITQSTDNLTSEIVNYTYDALQRLTKAETTGTEWGQAYTYDGFGNLTARNVTKGSQVPVSLSWTINPATNGGPTSFVQAVPGNLDVENRLLVGPNGEGYTYDSAGKRVMKALTGTWEITMYGIGGQKQVTALCQYNGGTSPSCAVTGRNVYFRGHLIRVNGVGVVTDRLGSVRANTSNERFSYYPYGEERTPTADGREKFGTYFRDGLTQDYADQRYYGPGTGRFNVPDPTMDNVDHANPGTWNAYAYVNGDPINFGDPEGLAACGSYIFNGTGQTVSQIMDGSSDLSYLAQTIWHEAGPMYSGDISNPSSFQTEQAYIGTALMNRYDMANGNLFGWTRSGQLENIPFGSQGTSVADIVLEAAGNNQSWGIYTNGQLNKSISSTLQSGLKTDTSVGTQVGVQGSLATISSTCYAITSAIVTANDVLNGERVNPAGTILLFWDLGPADGSAAPASGLTTIAKIRPSGNTFHGLLTGPPSKSQVRLPMPLPRPPIRTHGPAY